MTVRVVKIGGAALTDSAWLSSFAAAVSRAAGPVVIAHGGGPEISGLCERLSIPVSWNEGRRVTTPDGLDAAAMVLNGRVNKRIVSTLVGAGIEAIGLSGEDGGLIRASLADGGALGRVGVVAEIRVDLLRRLLAHGFVPVLSPISRGPDGLPLNVNADEVAAALAVALAAAELDFLTDVRGVSDGTAILPCLSPAAAASLLSAGVATGGMALKLRAALAALEAGVASVRIGPPAMLHDDAAGTRLGALEVAA